MITLSPDAAILGCDTRLSLLFNKILLSKVRPLSLLLLVMIALLPGVFSPQTVCSFPPEAEISGLTEPAVSLLRLVRLPNVPLSPVATIENTSRFPPVPFLRSDHARYTESPEADNFGVSDGEEGSPVMLVELLKVMPVSLLRLQNTSVLSSIPFT